MYIGIYIGVYISTYVGLLRISYVDYRCSKNGQSVPDILAELIISTPLISVKSSALVLLVFLVLQETLKNH